MQLLLHSIPICIVVQLLLISFNKVSNEVITYISLQEACGTNFWNLFMEMGGSYSSQKFCVFLLRFPFESYSASFSRIKTLFLHSKKTKKTKKTKKKKHLGTTIFLFIISHEQRRKHDPKYFYCRLVLWFKTCF